MSWSINLVGTPAKVIEALEKHASIQTGASKEEFDEVLPALKTLVGANVNEANPVAVHLEGNGHGYKDGEGKWQNKTCSIAVKPIYGLLV